MSRDLDGYDWEHSGEDDQHVADLGLTNTCPEHGEQAVTDLSSTGGSDPYGTDILACGCEVTSFGPGEPNVVIRKRHPRA